MSGFGNLSDNSSNLIFNRDAWGVTTIGLLVSSIISSILLGIFFQSGLGQFADGLTGLIVALFCLIIGAFLSYLFNRFTKSFPTFFKITIGAVLLNLLVFVLLRRDLSIGLLFFVAFGIIVLQGFLAGLIWTILSGRLRFILYKKRLFARFLALAIILLDIGIYYLFVASVQKDEATYQPQLNKNILEAMPASTILADSFRISSFYYGSGTDIQREAYQQGVAFNTKAFNLSEIIPEVNPYFGAAYKWFWGFDATSIPLNAQVWMPETDSLQHELVLIIHGGETITSDLENGFSYLAESLSSMGYLVIVPDLNFFNGLWLDLPHKEKLYARALLVQKHLKTLESWNKDERHEMFNKLDSLGRASIIGHGDGAGVARELIGLSKVNKIPYNAQIKSELNMDFTRIIELAPEQVSGKKVKPLNNINHLAIHAGYDAVNQPETYVPFISFSDTSRYFFSNTVSLYQANYAQFNEVLEGRDLRPPFNWFINQSAIMSGKMQRDITAQLVAGFISCASGNLQWLPMMQNPYYIKSLPREFIYLNQFIDNQTFILASFNEDIDPETPTFSMAYIEGNNLKVWQEVDYLHGAVYKDKGLMLGWDMSEQRGLSERLKKNATGSWSINLAPNFNEHMRLEKDASFIFSMVHLGQDGNKRTLKAGNLTDEEVFDFSIEFVDSIGIVNRIAFKNFASAATPKTPKIYKIPLLSKQQSNIFLQSYLLPLEGFYALNPDFDVSALEKIRLVFDKNISGRILLDNIGFVKKYTQRKTKEDETLESER